MLGYNRGLNLAELLERQREAQLSKSGEEQQVPVHHWGQSITINGNKTNNLQDHQNIEKNDVWNISSEKSDSSKKITLVKEWFQQATSSTNKTVTRTDAEAFLASWDITASNVSSVIWQEWVDAITYVLSSPSNVAEKTRSPDDSDDLSTAEYAYFPAISSIEYQQHGLVSAEGAAQLTSDNVSVTTTTTGANRYDQLNAKLHLDAVKHSFYGSPERDESPIMPLSPSQSEDEEPLGGVILETITESSEIAAVTPTAKLLDETGRCVGEVLEWSSGRNRFFRSQESEHNLCEDNLQFPMALPRQLFSAAGPGDSDVLKLDSQSTSTLTTPERFRPERVARRSDDTNFTTTTGGLPAERDREFTRRMVALGMGCTEDSPASEPGAPVQNSSYASNQSSMHTLESSKAVVLDERSAVQSSTPVDTREAEALHSTASPQAPPIGSSLSIPATATSAAGIAFDTTAGPLTEPEILQSSLSPQLVAESETCSVASSLSAPLQLRAPGKGFRNKGRVLLGKNRKSRNQQHRCSNEQQPFPVLTSSTNLSSAESVSSGKTSSSRLLRGLSAVSAGVLLLVFLLITGLSPRLAMWQQSQQQSVGGVPLQPSAAPQIFGFSAGIPTASADLEHDTPSAPTPTSCSSKNDEKSYFDLQVKLQPRNDHILNYNDSVKAGAQSTTAGSIIPSGPLAPLRWALRRIRRLVVTSALAVLTPFRVVWKALAEGY